MALIKLRKEQDLALIFAAIAAIIFSYWALSVLHDFWLYFIVGLVFVAPAYFFLLSDKEINVKDLAGIALLALLLPASMALFALLTKSAEKVMQFKIVEKKD